MADAPFQVAPDAWVRGSRFGLECVLQSPSATSQPGAQRTQSAFPGTGMDSTSVKQAIYEVLREFLLSADTTEVISRLTLLRPAFDASRTGDATPAPDGGDEFATEVVKRCIYVMLDSTPRETESLTTLLSALELCGAVSHLDLQSGVAVMEARLSDLSLDHPRAADVLGGVLAWLVLDDAIDEAFLGWGAGAPAARLVRGLALAAITEGAPYILQVRSMHRDLARRYFADGDAGALAAAVVGLNARHTAPEAFVKLVQVALADGAGGAASLDARCELASDALACLAESGALPPQAALLGALRLLRGAAQLALDCPGAEARVGRLLARALADGVLPPAFFALLPRSATEGRAAPPAPAPGVPPPPPSPPLANRLSRGVSAERGADGDWVVQQAQGGGGAATSAAAGGGASASPLALDAVAAARAVLAAAAALLPPAVTSPAGSPAAAAAALAALRPELAGCWGWRGALPLRAAFRECAALGDRLTRSLAAAGAPAPPAVEEAAAAAAALAAPPALRHEIVAAALRGLTTPGALAGGPTPQLLAAARAVAQACCALQAGGALGPADGAFPGPHGEARAPLLLGAARWLEAAEERWDALEEEDGEEGGDGDDAMAAPEAVAARRDALTASATRRAALEAVCGVVIRELAGARINGVAAIDAAALRHAAPGAAVSRDASEESDFLRRVGSAAAAPPQ